MSLSYFTLKDGYIQLSGTLPANDGIKIDRAIQELRTIRRVQKGDLYHVDFKKDDDFTPVDQETWNNDVARQWFNLNAEELVMRYQDLFESYCSVCKRGGLKPTKDGFRIFLMMYQSNKVQLN